jgi:hypothetical protein
MDWSDIAGIVFVCVTMNHLGLVKAIEETVGRDLPVVNCVKCSTFWVSLAYTLAATHDVITSLAVSFLCSYLALWLELSEGYIDTLYLRIYDKIYNTTDDTAAADPDGGNSAGSVS